MSIRITKLALLAFELNAALDTGKYNNISVQEIKDQIDNGTIFDFLENNLHGDIDLSLHDKGTRKMLLGEWQDLVWAVSAPRKFGVSNNGLCLLIAFLLEGIQRRQDNNPPVGS